MTQEQFNEAMAVIGYYHSTQLKINMPKNGFVGDLGRGEFTIHISRGCPGLMKALLRAGFSLCMDDVGLEVSKL